MRWALAQERAVAQFSSADFLSEREAEDPRMMAWMPLLAQINTAGFLTTGSQAGQADAPKGIEERAFVEGFMRVDQAADFLLAFSTQTALNAVVLPRVGDDVALPVALDLPLTLQRGQVATHMPMALPEQVWEQYRRLLKIDKREKVAYVLCWDPQWNRRGLLFNEVRRALEA